MLGTDTVQEIVDALPHARMQCLKIMRALPVSLCLFARSCVADGHVVCCSMCTLSLTPTQSVAYKAGCRLARRHGVPWKNAT